AAAGSLGTMVLAPLGQWLIDGFGWKAAMIGFAAIAGSMALLSLPIREPSRGHSVETINQKLGDAVREAMGHRGYLFMTAAFLAAPISQTSTLIFAAAMGFLWLGVAPLITGIIGRVFGLTHFNTLYGIVFLSHQLGSFFGAWMGGLVLDRFGNYDFAWGALIA